MGEFCLLSGDLEIKLRVRVQGLGFVAEGLVGGV